MTNDISNRPNGAISTYNDGRDPFEAFADEAAPRFLIGEPLTYKKGNWLLGQDNVPVGTALVVIMELLLHGWQRWEDSRPTTRLFARIARGERPPARMELGDNDSNQWAPDKFGNPRDPWQETMMLPMLSPDGATVATFSTSSWGGRKAIGELSRAYVKGRGKNPDAFPVVLLRSRTRHSPDYGSIQEPFFELADSWATRSSILPVLDTAGILELLDPASPPRTATQVNFTPNARARAGGAKPLGKEMDDEIPF